MTFLNSPMIKNELSSQTSYLQKQPIVLTKEEAVRYPELLQKPNNSDSVSEIRCIESEQLLIAERMVRLDLQKKQLQDMLNALQNMESDDDDDDDDEEDDDQST
jgi:hypothetical protein